MSVCTQLYGIKYTYSIQLIYTLLETTLTVCKQIINMFVCFNGISTFVGYLIPKPFS